MEKLMRNLVLSTLSTLALLIYPLSLSAQNSFSLSVDVDGAAGDQAVTSLNTSADQVIAIQIFGNNIQNANGLAVRFEYDANQVVYEGFDTGDILPNAQALPEQGTGYVEIGIASLGGQATANSGLFGTIRFRTTAAFLGTTIRLVRAELSRGGQFETVTLNTRVELQFQAVSPDFNRDGMVNFADFLAFGNQFGAHQGDGRYDAKYDLDSDGAIGFGDFLIFGRSFGQEVSTPNGGGGEEAQITIPDANLRTVIADSLGKARRASITQAEMASLTRLEAPDSDISDLTGLEFATNLTQLYLGEEYVAGGYVNSNHISDLAPLANLTKLTTLDLDGNFAFSDMSPLANLNNLRTLRLSNNFIKDISPLSGLTNLRHLNLGGTTISEVSLLSGLTNLTELVLDNNLISDISPLSGLTNLRYLSLTETGISDISPLSNLTNLEILNLGHNAISDISALAGLTNLTGLGLRGNVISDVSALSNLTNLTSLQLDLNIISDITPLANLIKLTSLELYYNTISDVSALAGLTSLTFLQLAENTITDISSLAGMTHLKTLGLSKNLISDMSALSALTRLERLELFSNAISDVSALAGLTNLGHLSLNDNVISNVSALAGLTRLTSLYLFNNLITELSPLSGLTSLKTLNLYNNNISDVSALSGLTNLETLNLNTNAISDLSPLVINTGLGSGDEVYVKNNPLSATSINTHIPALQSRGVNVNFSASKPAVEEIEPGSRLKHAPAWFKQGIMPR